MATNFERAKTIIRELFPQARENIKDPAVSVEDMVKKRLNQLSQGYGNNLLRKGRQPTIASLSFGALRTLVFKHKKKKEEPPKRLPLPDGSLLLMKGATQENWNHGINRENVTSDRINLTFRNILK